MLYRIFNFILESNISLPELSAVEKGTPSITFNLSSGTLPSDDNLDWVHHWRLSDGEISISCARRGDDYCLRFPQLADFLIHRRGDRIQCYRWPGEADDSVRHLLLDQVIPRVVAHLGGIVLHASAVQLEGGGVVFLGESGWGKSTLAASFHQNGYQVLTDDCLLVTMVRDQVHCVPGYAGSRLWVDSFEAIMGEQAVFGQVAQYSSKRRLIPDKNKVTVKGEIPVRAIIVLADPQLVQHGEEIRLEPITGQRAVMELVTHSFHLDISDHKKIGQQFGALGHVVTSGVPVYRLWYPRDHTLLPAVHATVVKAIVQGGD